MAYRPGHGLLNIINFVEIQATRKNSYPSVHESGTVVDQTGIPYDNVVQMFDQWNTILITQRSQLKCDALS